MAGDKSKESTQLIIEATSLIDDVFPEVPLIAKLSYAQSYLEIARGIADRVDAISINSVPAHCLTEEERKKCFRWYGGKDPMEKFGGGSISGGPAKLYQGTMLKNISELPDVGVPLIGPGIRKYDDLRILSMLGASAFSFGHVFLPCAPWWRPQRIVNKYLQNRN